jgi:uncharacterized membrane protein (UPF0127 family)
MDSAGRFSVHNRTRGTTLAADVRLADTPGSRRIGLLRHKTLEPGQGLWIYPTQAIHTFGMRFPIDVAFLDRRLRIKRVYHGLRPFRLTWPVWGARSVLELPHGSLEGAGDQLQISPRDEASQGGIP